jgi:Phasin protein
MPTIEEDKAAKPRQRSRKTEQRNPKSEQKAAARPDSDTIDAGVVPAEAAPVEATPMVAAPLAIAVESVPEVALSGEVLPPEIRAHAPQTAGAQAIALAYGEYAQNSWAAGGFLVERLIAARSLNEAMEIQGEFAKQSYVNFFAQSQKIWELYGEWVQQFFRPFDKFAAAGRDQGSHTLH